jgi:hypothetical protein
MIVILPANERDVIAKPRAKQAEEAVAVAGFLIGHGVEQLSRIRVVIPQAVGELAVNTAVLLLEVIASASSSCSERSEKFFIGSSGIHD